MKKWILTILAVAALCLLTACGNETNTVSGRTGKQSIGVSDILQERIAEENSRNIPETEKPATDPAPTEGAEQASEPAVAGEETVSAQTGKEEKPASELMGAAEEPAPELMEAVEEPASEQPEAEEEPTPEMTGEQDAAAEGSPAGDGYDVPDVDLTAISGTMVYAEVYQMLTSPENYMGKTIRMDGAFTYYHDEATGQYYLACIVQDATACCAQGIEFVPAGSFRYPEDFPEVGETVCVQGVFDTYEEGDYMYCTLRNAVFVK